MCAGTEAGTQLATAELLPTSPEAKSSSLPTSLQLQGTIYWVSKLDVLPLSPQSRPDLTLLQSTAELLLISEIWVKYVNGPDLMQRNPQLCNDPLQAGLHPCLFQLCSVPPILLGK